MTMGPGEAAAPRTVSEALTAVGSKVRGSDDALVPGASLLLVTFCRKHGITIDDEGLDALAEFLELTLEDVSGVVSFHDTMIRSQHFPGMPVSLCRGLSCTMHGAERFHEQLRAGIAAQDAQPDFVEVFCLGHCEIGPNLTIDNQTYCGREQRRIVDRRDWRPDDTGPVSLDDQSVPVRD